jgi:hypothetical protein
LRPTATPGVTKIPFVVASTPLTLSETVMERVPAVTKVAVKLCVPASAAEKM